MSNYNEELTAFGAAMPPQRAGTNGTGPTWTCPGPGCREIFVSQLEMTRHQRRKCHWRCVACGMDFVDQDTLGIHNAQTHPEPQELTCPGCGTAFIRAGALMQHIEGRHCVVITPEHLHEQRKKETDFNESLRFLNPANEEFLLTGRMAKLDIKHRPSARPAQRISTRSGNTTYPTVHQDLTGYRTGYAKVPDLLTGEGQEQSAYIAAGSSEKDKKEGLFPLAAEDKMRPQGRKLERFIQAEAEPSLVIPNAGQRVIDPKAPGFNAAVFYHPIVEKFKCPHPGCHSSFLKERGLVAHLKSLAHTPEVKFTCPCCLRSFAGMQAAIQHAEMASRTCRINQTDEFRSFIHHVTGGLLDGFNSEKECLKDGSPRIIVPKKFIESFPIPLRYARMRPELEKLGSGRMVDWDDEKGELYPDLLSTRTASVADEKLEGKPSGAQTRQSEPKYGW